MDLEFPSDIPSSVLPSSSFLERDEKFGSLSGSTIVSSLPDAMGRLNLTSPFSSSSSPSTSSLPDEKGRMSLSSPVSSSSSTSSMGLAWVQESKREMNLIRAPIVVGGEEANLYESKQHDQKENKVKSKFQTNGKTVHYFLIVDSRNRYTAQELENCQGKYPCFHCGRPIPQRMYFYPLPSDELTSFHCYPIPHCRPECCLAHITFDIQNNADLISCFHSMYGTEVFCANPRQVLWLGVSIQEFHQMIEDRITILMSQNHPSNPRFPYIQHFMAPVFLSCTITDKHQLTDGVVQAIDLLYQKDDSSNVGQEQPNMTQEKPAQSIQAPTRPLSQYLSVIHQ